MNFVIKYGDSIWKLIKAIAVLSFICGGFYYGSTASASKESNPQMIDEIKMIKQDVAKIKEDNVEMKVMLGRIDERTKRR